MSNKEKMLLSKTKAEQDNLILTQKDKENPDDGKIVIQILKNKSFQRKVFSCSKQNKDERHY